MPGSKQQINVMVSGGSYDSQAAYSALRFCRAASNAGHKVTQVFFYQAGAAVGNVLSEPLADEFNATQSWADFAETLGIPLVVCVSAAERRGVMGEEQRQDHDKPVANLHGAFRIEGLTSFHSACLKADRTVVFK